MIRDRRNNFTILTEDMHKSNTIQGHLKDDKNKFAFVAEAYKFNANGARETLLDSVDTDMMAAERLILRLNKSIQDFRPMSPANQNKEVYLTEIAGSGMFSSKKDGPFYNKVFNKLKDAKYKSIQLRDGTIINKGRHCTSNKVIY